MNTRTKIAASGLVIAALAASTAPAFASNKSVSTKANIHSRQMHGLPRHHVGPLAALVAAGAITQANADAVETATRTAMHSAETANFKAALAALVANNTITQALADAATAALPSATAPMRMHDHLIFASWTIAQRSALHTWLEANPIDRAAIGKAAVAQLVTAGTLSQAQADAVNAALAAFPARGMSPERGMHPEWGMGPDGGRRGGMGEHRGQGRHGGHRQGISGTTPNA
ncbi:MAG: hypothetical protein ACYC3W_01210 [Candidatus Nanopelagicales bacterium]